MKKEDKISLQGLTDRFNSLKKQFNEGYSVLEESHTLMIDVINFREGFPEDSMDADVLKLDDLYFDVDDLIKEQNEEFVVDNYGEYF